MQFIDLAAQQAGIRKNIDKRIADILDRGTYIMGAEVKELEEKLATFCGARHCITCANGTDALVLALMALDIGPGDAVIVPSFTFAASAEAPCLVQATPVFCDVDPATFNLSPESVLRCIDAAKASQLTPKAIIGVDLFGLPADWPEIANIAKANDLHLIDDSAQGWGGSINGKKTGTFGTITTTSFFPAKPLGCYGDGGALFTEDPELAQKLDSLRVHGKGSDKYDNIRVGMNSRLDTLQAGILLEKLAIYSDELTARQVVAERYTNALHNLFTAPCVPDGYQSIWAQYTLKAKDEDHRETAMGQLREAGIPSMVYYPTPLHTLSAYRKMPTDPNGLAVSEDLAKRVFSLPMHPYLAPADQDRVIEALHGQ